MIKVKTLGARVGGSGKVVKNKLKTSKEISMRTQIKVPVKSDDFDDDFDKPQVVDNKQVAASPKTKQIPWSQDEDRYVEYCIGKLWQYEEKVSHHCLGEVATHLNKKFHNGEPVRNNSSLWWHINTKQKNGGFPGFTIMPGSPKTTKDYGGPPLGHNGKGNVLGTRSAAAQKITGAIREPAPPPQRPQQAKVDPAPTKFSRAAQKIVSADGGAMIEVLLKDATGKIERFSTSKFSTIEEAMFALT